MGALPKGSRPSRSPWFSARRARAPHRRSIRSWKQASLTFSPGSPGRCRACIRKPTAGSPKWRRSAIFFKTARRAATCSKRSGCWNSPEGLAALLENPQVHYEPGASEYGRTVADLLPTAVARVEAIQQRQFAHPVTIGVYVSREAFAAANGVGDSGAVGVTFFGHVILSPGLFSAQRQRSPAHLTHELSHAHLQSWLSPLAYIRLPNWFKEGRAVMVSGGGGAERVSEVQAREAIRSGDHIAVESAGSLLNLAAVKFEQRPEIPNTSFRILMAYRQVLPAP